MRVAWLVFRSMSRRRVLTGLVLSVVPAVPTLAACTSDDDRLVVYSGRTSNLIGPLLEDFADESGISIDVRYDDSANLALLIDEEGDRTPADVFVSLLRDQLGEDEASAWLDGMAAGNPPTFNDNAAIVEAVARGEVPMGLV